MYGINLYNMTLALCIESLKYIYIFFDTLIYELNLEDNFYQ